MLQVQDGVLIITAYMLGSISSAIIVCRLMGLPDPRTEGSNNPGATNVLRIGGKKAAFITLVGDALKGILPVLFVHWLEGDVTKPLLFALVGLAAFLGHLYPVWFGLHGGKGVATALGVQFGLHWMIGGGVAILWFIIARLTKVSSIAALISMAIAPVIVWVVWPTLELLIMQFVVSALLFWRHRDNIRRLFTGEETKIAETD